MTTTEVVRRSPYVTAENLTGYEPCPGQLRRFARLFPDGAILTESCARMVADLFDWHWLARFLLEDSGYSHYYCDVRFNGCPVWIGDCSHDERLGCASSFVECAMGYGLKSVEPMDQEDIGWFYPFLIER